MRGEVDGRIVVAAIVTSRGETSALVQTNLVVEIVPVGVDAAGSTSDSA